MSHSAVHHSVAQVAHQLQDVLMAIGEERYSHACNSLFGASIGQHTRHIIDMFTKLEQGYHAGLVNYDHRERDARIETEPTYAHLKITHLVANLPADDKRLRIQSEHPTGMVHLDSCAYREVLYCLEHCIHHMALIKVGLLELGFEGIPANFGVAYSTIAYKQQSAR
jgi:hypothetical protein